MEVTEWHVSLLLKYLDLSTATKRYIHSAILFWCINTDKRTGTLASIIAERSKYYDGPYKDSQPDLVLLPGSNVFLVPNCNKGTTLSLAANLNAFNVSVYYLFTTTQDISAALVSSCTSVYQLMRNKSYVLGLAGIIKDIVPLDYEVMEHDMTTGTNRVKLSSDTSSSLHVYEKTFSDPLVEFGCNYCKMNFVNSVETFKRPTFVFRSAADVLFITEFINPMISSKHGEEHGASDGKDLLDSDPLAATAEDHLQDGQRISEVPDSEDYLP